jgi:hypothetical protein
VRQALNLRSQYGLTPELTFLAYRPELISAFPLALLLVGAWLKRSWAVPGLILAAIIGPLLKFSLGGVPTAAWWINAVLFWGLGLHLHRQLKQKA